jgi:single-strand DNA-binding protein
MNDLNRFTAIGRLTKDPELRHVPSGTAVTSFSIANNRSYTKNGEKSEEVSYFECIAWGKLGEIIAQYCKKGQLLGIDGRLQQCRWEDNEGKFRSKIEVVVENIQFLSGKSQEKKEESEPELFNDAHPVSDDDIPF